MSTYNGWANYATWRVRLEIFDDDEFFEDYTAQDCKEYCDGYLDGWMDTLSPGSGYNLIVGFAIAFTDDVNWREIAESLRSPRWSDEEKATTIAFVKERLKD